MEIKEFAKSMIFRKTKTQDLRRTGSWKPKKDDRLFLSRTRSEPEADKSLSATENWVATLPDLPPMRPSKLYYHLHQTCKFYTIYRLLMTTKSASGIVWPRLSRYLTHSLGQPEAFFMVTRSLGQPIPDSPHGHVLPRSTNTWRSSWSRVASVNQYLTIIMVKRCLGQPIPEGPHWK